MKKDKSLIKFMMLIDVKIQKNIGILTFTCIHFTHTHTHKINRLKFVKSRQDGFVC